jgi:PPK2 family polyphosphate:nucleotide phosphotransferase
LAEAQEMLYADDSWSLLAIFQAMDAAGKDSTIKHVMSGINPQGCQVYSFKHPSSEELDHNFLWRCMRALPERGRIGIFNRSHYEDVAVVRVFPDLLKKTAHGRDEVNDQFWKERFQDINHLESVVVRGGTIILKFFLHLSKEEQRNRLLARLNDPRKQWKFNPDDLVVRDHWDGYMHAYGDAISNTSTVAAPWWVVPADRKWAMRAIVAEVLWHTVRDLALEYPPLDDEKQAAIQKAREALGTGE